MEEGLVKLDVKAHFLQYSFIYSNLLWLNIRFIFKHIQGPFLSFVEASGNLAYPRQKYSFYLLKNRCSVENYIVVAVTNQGQLTQQRQSTTVILIRGDKLNKVSLVLIFSC